MKKKYRMYYMNIETGEEFFIEVDNNDEILPALNKNLNMFVTQTNGSVLTKKKLNRRR